MNIKRETTISTLDEMCELMCGGVDEDYEYDENEEEVWLRLIIVNTHYVITVV